MKALNKLQSTILRRTRPLRYALEAAAYQAFADTGALQDLKGAARGRPLLIVGNGPSLNSTPLDAFAGASSIGMNKIDLIYKRTDWRPSLVLCSNNLVMKQHWQNWLQHGVPAFLAWKGRHFVNRAHRSKFSYYNANIDDHFSTNIVHDVGIGVTVTYAALQFAYFMQADPVVIVGVDHSFAAPRETGAYVKMATDDANHFDPNYFAKGTYWGLPDLERSEINFALARAAFEREGRKVLDATIGGKLEIFPKIPVEEAVRLFS